MLLNTLTNKTRIWFFSKNLCNSYLCNNLDIIDTIHDYSAIIFLLLIPQLEHQTGATRLSSLGYCGFPPILHWYAGILYCCRADFCRFLCATLIPQLDKPGGCVGGGTDGPVSANGIFVTMIYFKGEGHIGATGHICSRDWMVNQITISFQAPQKTMKPLISSFHLC